MFSKTKANKTYWFPDRPDIECFVITEFLDDFDFNSDKDTKADRSHKLSLPSCRLKVTNSLPTKRGTRGCEAAAQ